MPVVAGGQGKGFSSSQRRYTKKLLCAKLNVGSQPHISQHKGGRLDEEPRKRHIQFSTHDMKMLIPYRVHAKVSQKGDLRSIACGDRKNIERIM